MIGRRRGLAAIGLAFAGLAGAACSSDKDASDTTAPGTTVEDTTGITDAPGTTAASAGAADYSVAEWLQQVPVAATTVDTGDGSDRTDDTTDTRGDGYASTLLYTADLDAASAAAGLDRPAVGTLDVDEFANWLLPITGVGRDGKPALADALVPDAANPNQLQQIGDIHDELGWTLSDVHAFIEYAEPPKTFTVLSGDFDEAAIEQAMGTPHDGVYELGDEDFAIDISAVSPARPLGEAVRIGLDDGKLATARSVPQVESWLAKGGDTLADDDGLAGVAASLDANEVYSAMLVEGSFAGFPNLPSQATLPEVATGLGPFTALGVGLTVDAGTPVAVFSYYYPNERDAATAVQTFTDLVATGESFVDRSKWSDRFTVRDVGADGHVLTGVLELHDDVSPGIVWKIVQNRDSFAIGSV